MTSKAEFDPFAHEPEGAAVKPPKVGKAGEKRTSQAGQFVICRVTTDQRELLQRAADLEGQQLSTWCRSVLLTAAEAAGALEPPSDFDL